MLLAVLGPGYYFLLFFTQDDILGSFGVGPAAVSVQPAPMPILTLASRCTLEPQQFQAKWVALPVAATFQVNSVLFVNLF